MKTYEVLLNPRAADELNQLPREAVGRIKEGLKHLRTNPTKAKSGADVKQLTGISDPKLFRLRVGDYRAIFWVDEKKGEVLVEKIAPRKRVYNGISR